MDELDDLLRDTFRTRDDEALDAAGLAASAKTGYARRTAKRRRLVAVGTVGVLAAGGSSALALTRHGPAASGPTTAPLLNSTTGDHGDHGTGASATTAATSATPKAIATSVPPPRPGTRAWSSHGLQVRVPQAWKANQTDCGTPIANTVVIGGGAIPMCAINPVPAVDVVEFGTATNPGVEVQPALTLHPTTVEGHDAQTGTEQIADGRTVTVLVVPDLDVSITVKSKDAALVAEIVASAQIVDTDANGCPTRAATLEPTGAPDRPGAQSTMVPGTPTKAIVCHYSTPYVPNQPAPSSPTLLTNGSTIAPDQIPALTATLNSLKPGLATWDGLAGFCPSATHDGYLLRFTYATGQPVDVYLHTSDCDHNGFSNGAVTGFMSQKFVDDVPEFLPDMAFQADGNAVK